MILDYDFTWFGRTFLDWSSAAKEASILEQVRA